MLTAKQEKFCKLIVEGYTQADAYRNSYSPKKMTDNAIYREASVIAAKPKIAQRISELRNQAASNSIMTASQRLEWLTSIIRSDNVMLSDKLKASDQMNKMQGEYIQKVKADVNQNIDIVVELIDD